MNNFIVCLNAVLPVFLTLSYGYFFKRLGFIKQDQVTWLNSLTFKAFMPIMSFYIVYSSDISTTFNPKLVIFAISAIFVEFFLGLVISKTVASDEKSIGALTQGIYRSNFVVIGLPVASSLVEADNLGSVAVLIALVAPVYNSLAVIVLERYSGKSVNKKRILLNILKNPLIVGVAVGALASVMKVRLPAPLEKAVSQISDVANPLMLFSLGAFFDFKEIGENRRELIISCIGRLIVMPGLCLTAAALLGFRGIEFAGLLGLFASGVAVATFTMTQQMGGNGKLAGDEVVMTSALCSFTMFMWSYIFKSLGVI